MLQRCDSNFKIVAECEFVIVYTYREKSECPENEQMGAETMEKWFYEQNGEQLGPISTEALKALRMASEISHANLVWKEGMADWAPYGEVFSAAGEGSSKLKLGKQKCPSCMVSVSPNDLIPAGDRMVCPACKDDYAQSLKEGIRAPEVITEESRGTGGATPISELRAMARTALSGQWGTAVLAVFVATIIQQVVAFIPIVGSLVPFFIAGAFQFGLANYFLSLSRDEPVEVGDIFSGFSIYGRTLGIYFVMSILVGLATFAAAIPGVILMAVSGVFSSEFLASEEVNPMFLVGMIVSIVPAIIVACYMYLRYSMAYFICREAPDLTATECLSGSAQLMVGHKMKLFALGLSFIGWAFLGMMFFFIGLLWVMAYYYAALAAFYDDIAD